MSTGARYNFSGIWEAGSRLFYCFDDMRGFDGSDGMLVAGDLDGFLDWCSAGGGAVISNPSCTKEYTDVPMYMCAVLPQSSLTNVSVALRRGHNKSDNWMITGFSRGGSRSPCSYSHAAYLCPLWGAWWFLPLLGSLALAVIS